MTLNRRVFASCVRPLLEFHGNLANGRGPPHEPFLRASCVAHMAAFFFSLFFLFPYRRRAIFWEVGVPLSGFRSIVFRPACSSPRPPAENAPTLHSRERVQAQDRIIPTCSCHARTYTDAPRLPWYAAFSIRRVAGEVFFALEHTRQLVSLNTAAAARRR